MVRQEWNSLHCIWSRYLAGKAPSNHETARRGWFMAKSLNWMLVFHRKIYFLDQSETRKFVWSIFWIGCIFNCSFIKTILSHTAIIKLFYELILRTLKDIDPPRLVDPYLLLLNAFQNDQSHWVWWRDSQAALTKGEWESFRPVRNFLKVMMWRPATAEKGGTGNLREAAFVGSASETLYTTFVPCMSLFWIEKQLPKGQ